MLFKETPLKGCFAIEFQPTADERGWFSRVYCENEFKAINHSKPFVQFNHSFNRAAGTIRGLHYQKPPFQETKLIRCISGSVYDVVVDIRQNSPTFLKHFGLKLSAVNNTMIYIPSGFAHGFQTLEENTQLLYHHTEFYQPGFEAGLRYNDAKLEITWELPPSIISERDKNFDLLTESFQGI